MQIEQGKKNLVFRINGRLKNENIVTVIEEFLQKNIRIQKQKKSFLYIKQIRKLVFII